MKTVANYFQAVRGNLTNSVSSKYTLDTIQGIMKRTGTPGGVGGANNRTHDHMKINTVINTDYSNQHSFTFTFRALSRHFYPERLTSVKTHIDTPTAESTMQGYSQLVRSQELGLSVLFRDTSTLS